MHDDVYRNTTSNTTGCCQVHSSMSLIGGLYKNIIAFEQMAQISVCWQSTILLQRINFR